MQTQQRNTSRGLSGTIDNPQEAHKTPMLQVLSKQHQPRKHKATETKTSLQDSMGSARTTIKL